MGRNKIQMQMIKKKNYRNVTFTKRRQGLFKKAADLCVLCNAQIAIVTFSQKGKCFSFGHTSVDSLLTHYRNGTTPEPCKVTSSPHVRSILDNIARMEKELEGKAEGFSLEGFESLEELERMKSGIEKQRDNLLRKLAEMQSLRVSGFCMDGNDVMVPMLEAKDGAGPSQQPDDDLSVFSNPSMEMANAEGESNYDNSMLLNCDDHQGRHPLIITTEMANVNLQGNLQPLITTTVFSNPSMEMDNGERQWNDSNCGDHHNQHPLITTTEMANVNLQGDLHPLITTTEIGNVNIQGDLQPGGDLSVFSNPSMEMANAEVPAMEEQSNDDNSILLSCYDKYNLHPLITTTTEMANVELHGNLHPSITTEMGKANLQAMEGQRQSNCDDLMFSNCDDLVNLPLLNYSTEIDNVHLSAIEGQLDDNYSVFINYGDLFNLTPFEEIGDVIVNFPAMKEIPDSPLDGNLPWNEKLWQ